MKRLVALLFLMSAPARADVLRIATEAPDGTAWAREMTAFSRNVAEETNGALQVKFYFGGIAGDEFQSGERIRRGQLDGVISGGMLCSRISPSMRVMSVLGLFQTRAESTYVVQRLKPTIDKEFQAAGYTNVGEAGVGSYIIFSRDPIRSLDDLRKHHFWIWNTDAVANAQLKALGVPIVPTTLDQASKAYASGAVDGFITVPSAALAFQWSTQARYFTDLHLGYLTGCLVVANRALDALPIASRRGFLNAAAKLQRRIEEVGAQQDAALLGGLFEKQGMKAAPADERFRADLFEAARNVREKLGGELAPIKTLQEAVTMLADYRAEHPH